MIDLHSHTTQSDGTLTPPELVQKAVALGLEALAITDHDTLAGFDIAVPAAKDAGLDLICGIEMSSKYRGKSVHLLGYFLNGDPGNEFRTWILNLQESRHRRNEAMIQKLRDANFEVTLEEWYIRGGTLPGRPHLAAILLEKGYVASIQEAFDKYLAESGDHYTARAEPQISECIERILAAGGFPVVPHPGRVSKDRAVLEEYLAAWKEMGLLGLEVHHSDHSAADRELYQDLADQFGFTISGGSDFHGSTKPKVALGTGVDGNVSVPLSVLTNLREQAKLRA